MQRAILWIFGEQIVKNLSDTTTLYQFAERARPQSYRQAVRGELVGAIRAREPRLIVSVSGMGVSNMLRFFAATHTFPISAELPNTRLVYFNSKELGRAPSLEQVLEEICFLLHEQGIPMATQVRSWFRQLKQMLMQIERAAAQSAETAPVRLAILFDHASAIARNWGGNEFTKLEALREEFKWLTFLIAVNPTAPPVIDSITRMFISRRIYVPSLNPADFAFALVEEAGRIGLSPDTLTAHDEMLYRWTGGHPALLRHTCKLFSAETPPTLPQVLATKNIENRCHYMWKHLTQPERESLLQLTIELTAEKPVPALIQLGLVRWQDDQWGCFSLLLEQFVQRFATGVDSAEPPPLQFNIYDYQKLTNATVAVGTLHRGTETIPLTTNEMRFISCLMVQGRICSREELLRYIYGDELNPEENPGSRIDNIKRQVHAKLGPGYIEAIYGRGYRLNMDRVNPLKFAQTIQPHTRTPSASANQSVHDN